MKFSAFMKLLQPKAELLPEVMPPNEEERLMFLLDVFSNRDARQRAMIEAYEMQIIQLREQIAWFHGSLSISDGGANGPH